MNVTVLMDIKESNVKTLSIGAHRIHVRMAHHVYNKRMFSIVTAHQDGQEKCVMLRWYHARMQL